MKLTPEAIKEQFIEILIEQLGIDPADITDQSKLNELGADSPDVVEVVMVVEVEFGIDISDEAAESLLTVQDFLTLIETEQA